MAAAIRTVGIWAGHRHNSLPNHGRRANLAVLLRARTVKFSGIFGSNLEAGVDPRPIYRKLQNAGIASAVHRQRRSSPAPRAGEALSVPEKDHGHMRRGLKIAVLVITWWAFGVAFNIYNKKVLNAFPFPWLTSALSLAAGSMIMVFAWATGIAEPPPTDVAFWKALTPVAVAHTVGQVGTTVSVSKVDVSFTHIIKSAEPAFSVLFSQIFMGENFPLAVYVALFPIIGGCALAAVTELNFNLTGFMGAMISNVAFVFRNNFSKRAMRGKAVDGMNYYACLTMMSLVILMPLAFVVEGPQRWVAGWQKAVEQMGSQFAWWVVAQSVFYHLYNQVSYISLKEITPLTFSIGNTMKRVAIIVSSIIIFRTTVNPINALGATIAIVGTFFYSQVKQ